MDFQFTHIELKNWRNFKEVSLNLRERVFIVGPNASGKTNLLDAFRFLRDIAQPDGSLARAIKIRGGLSHLRSLHARQDSEVRICVRVRLGSDEWRYELAVRGAKNQSHQISNEAVWLNGKEKLARPNAQDESDPRLLEQTHLEQLSQNGDFRALVDALASVEAVHVVPQVAKSALRAEESALHDAPGSDFIERLAELPEKKQKGMLRKIEKLLRVAVPHFKSLRIVRDKRSGVPHLEANYAHWRPQGSWQNETEFSDGTLRLVGLFWALLQGDSPLLLEEPELSLHDAVVQQLPNLIARASAISGRQVLISTHAERMLDAKGIDPGEIVLLAAGQDTTARIASEDVSIVQAAKAELPLGMIVSGRTRPDGIENLVLPFAEGLQ